VNRWAVINSLKTVWHSNHSGECSIKSGYQVTAGTLAVFCAKCGTVRRFSSVLLLSVLWFWHKESIQM